MRGREGARGRLAAPGRGTVAPGSRRDRGTVAPGSRRHITAERAVSGQVSGQRGEQEAQLPLASSRGGPGFPGVGVGFPAPRFAPQLPPPDALPAPLSLPI